ncbi:MAG: cyclodeaminase/cyclohydrolase family protein [Microgenomates group bacterium]
MSSVREKKIKEFLKELSSNSPTPGGGAVAALVGSMAASLIEMVANLTVGKKGYEDVNEEMKKLGERARRLRKDLLTLSEKDIKAYDEVVRAYRASTNVQRALKIATDVPLQTALLSNEVIQLAKEVIKKGNKKAVSDAKSALFLAQAAKSSALENVKINLISIKNPKLKEKINLVVARLR